jgi:hypothetical protein
MSALTHLDTVATHVTRFSGGPAEEASNILLVVAMVAMGAAGLGLVLLCARALLGPSRRAATKPWIAEALASPTLHTRKYAEAEINAAHAAAAPASGTAAPAGAPPSSGIGPSSTDPTLEMDLGAFASFAAAEIDFPPIEPAPPSEPTQVMEGSPVLLVARKGVVAPSFEIPPPPLEAGSPANDAEGNALTVHRSGTLPRADRYLPTMATFTDGARRA